MATFFMYGKYSFDAVKEIHPERTTKAIKIIEALGGKVEGMYAVLGDYDLVLIVGAPDIDTIVKISVDLYMITGIHFSSVPAMPVDYFDAIIEKESK
ncbi:MAG: GYD domain-containing protein [Thermodesulfovibrionales bacterium]